MWYNKPCTFTEYFLSSNKKEKETMGTREDVRSLLGGIARHALSEFASSETGRRLKEQGLSALLGTGTRTPASGVDPGVRLERLIPQLGEPLAEAVLYYALSKELEREDARNTLVTIITDYLLSSGDREKAIKALLLVDEIRSADIERRLRAIERAR
jgi:hypothetical protein